MRRRRLLGICTLAVIAILAALVAGLFRFAARAAPGYRTQLEQRASQATGYPVTIGSLSLSWRGWQPTLDLRDVAVLPNPASSGTAAGGATTPEPLLHLGGLRLWFSLWRAARRDWLPVRADLRGLALRADVDEVGHWSVHGFGDTGGSGDAAPVLHELQRLKRLRLLDSQLEVHDVALHAPLSFRMPLADVRHVGDSFHIRADVQPPADMAAAARLRGELRGDLGQSDQLDGDWQLRLSELRGWPWLTQELADNTTLRLSGASLSLQGRMRSGQVDAIEVQAQAAQIAAMRDDQLLAQLAQFRLRGKAEPTAQCWKAGIDQLELDGVRGHWSAGHMQYECLHGANGFAIHASVARLRLDDLAPWLGLWKDLPARAARIRDVRGDLLDVQLDTQPPDADDRGEPRNWLHLAAHLQDGALAAAGEQPGIAGLDADISADNDGGHLSIAPTSAGQAALTLTLPRTFAQPLPLEAFSIELSWRRIGGEWHLSAPQFDWQAAGTSGRGAFDLRLAADASPQLTLNAQFSGSDVERLKPWMPLDWKPQTRDWLARALVKGHVPRARLVLDGALADYPVTKPGSGRPSGHPGANWGIDLELADFTLAFSPEWTPIEQLHGQLLIRAKGLSIAADGGQLGGAVIDHIDASIADFRDAQLLLDGSVQGEADRFYEVLRASPLHRRLSGLIDKTDMTGAAHLDLHLEVPLNAAAQGTRARGHVRLTGVTLGVHGLLRPIENLSGALDFGGFGVSAESLDGRFYQQPLHASIHAEADVPTGVLEAHTRLPMATADGLAAAYLPDWLRRQLQGETTLHARLPLGGADDGRLSLATDLRGVTSRLPPPLAKEMDGVLPITAHLDGEPLRLGIEVADAMRLGLRFSAAGGDSESGGSTVRGIEVRLDNGAIPRAEAEGIVVDGAPAVLDLGPWIPFVADIGAEGTPAGDVASDAAAGGKPLKFIAANLRPQRLLYGDFVLLAPQLQVLPSDGGYRLNLSGDSAAGSIDWSKADNGRVTARLRHLKFEPVAPRGDAPAAPAAHNDAPPFSPVRAPTLDLRCEDLQGGAARLGRLSLNSTRIDGGQQLTLQLQGGDLEADAQGRWLRADAQSQGALDLSINGGNLGAVFTAFGYPQTIAAKQTRLKAELDWRPDAIGLQWSQATGTVELDLHQGDLKNIEPGAGRALGLFSLYALPRRLLLDFRDVFAAGLSFDRLAGKFVLGAAQARTDDLELRAPSLRIAIHGRIGLAARDYDEHVTVYPDVTTGVTIAGGLAGGPIGAAVALVAQELFGKPFNKLSQFSYHVTGPWNDPRIKHGEAHKDECPQDTAAGEKAPTDAQGKACAPRVGRAPKAAPAISVPVAAPSSVPPAESGAAPAARMDTDADSVLPAAADQSSSSQPSTPPETLP